MIFLFVYEFFSIVKVRWHQNKLPAGGSEHPYATNSFKWRRTKLPPYIVAMPLLMWYGLLGSAARLFHLKMNKIARFCGVQRKYSRLCHHHLIAAPAQPHNVGAMMAECALDVCYGCMEKNKKSPRWGCEGWRPIVGVMSKSNGKQAPPLSFAFTPTVTREARHSPPSPLRKKSRFAKKKSAPPK